MWLFSKKRTHLPNVFPWTAVDGCPHCSLSSNSFLWSLNCFHHMYIVIQDAVSSPNACCIVVYISTNNFWRQAQNFIALLCSIARVMHKVIQTHWTQPDVTQDWSDKMRWNFVHTLPRHRTLSFCCCSQDGATCVTYSHTVQELFRHTVYSPSGFLSLSNYLDYQLFRPSLWLFRLSVQVCRQFFSLTI